MPRFGLDTHGEWVVSHSPFVCVPWKGADDSLMLVLTAILNSSITSWYIDLNARKYRSQYNKLGVALLRRVPMPDLSRISLLTLRRVMDLTNELVCISNDYDIEVSQELDYMVMRDLFLLSDKEISLVAP